MDTLNALVAFGNDFGLKKRLVTTLAGDVPVSYTFCESGKEALRTFMASQWDLCIISENLPALSGVKLTQKIRRQNEVVPLIFLMDKEKRVQLYRAGADIVLPSDFNAQIYAYRTAALVKRSPAPPQEAVHQFLNFSFDFASAMLTTHDGGTKIALSPHQAGILNLLLSHPNQTLHRAEILRAVWQKDSYYNGRSMDVLINKLRSKLAALPGLTIETIHSIGFRLIVEREYFGNQNVIHL